MSEPEAQREVRPAATGEGIRTSAVTLAHGGGGKAMHDLIEQVFVRAFEGDRSAPLEDQARFDLSELVSQGDRGHGRIAGMEGM